VIIKERDKQVELRRYIATQLERKRISQRELADKLGRDPSSVSNWIHGRQPIPLDMLDDIAAAIEERSPIKLYKMAGLFSKLPNGADRLVDMMAVATDDQLDLMARLSEALLSKEQQ
jgi:transcriptional regulator with XRE-family HTH domain